MANRTWPYKDGIKRIIWQTDSGQQVVKITPEEWDQCSEEEKQAIIQEDIHLARQFSLEALDYQRSASGRRFGR